MVGRLVTELSFRPEFTCVCIDYVSVTHHRMTSIKRILYIFYTLLFILTLAMAFYNESLLATFNREAMYTFWMYWALFGFVLLMFESVLENVFHSQINRSNRKLLHENNELKARMYDEMMRTRTGEVPPPIQTQENRPKP
jgi:hypothetical protein